MKRILLNAVLLAASLAVSAEDLRIRSTGRTILIRNEEKAALTLTLSNQTSAALTGITLSAGEPFTCKVADLAPGEKREVRFPVETNLSIGKHTAELRYTANGGKVSGTEKLSYEITPMIHDRMLSVLWDSGNFRPLADLGFEESIGYISWAIFSQPGNGFETDFAADALRRGYRHYDAVCFPPELHKKYPRLTRAGKPRTEYPSNMNAADPDFLKEWNAFFDKVLKIAADRPVFNGFMIFSESQDGAQPDFSKTSRDAFKKFAGYDIPQQVETRAAPHWSTLRDFPADRVIREDYPLYVYYKWFWKTGSGWNPLITSAHRRIKAEIPRKTFTFFDPAVRFPPVWGCGGESDYISQWTYAYPDPLRVSVAASELHAMAAGRPGQKIMNMTQNIAYRKDVAPRGAKCANPPAWLAKEEAAAFVTLAPDLMRTASMMMAARQTSGVMFHGYNTLIGVPGSKHSYRYTNSETKEVVREFLAKVVKPLGPALKRVPERPAEVAVLESFASSVFAGRGTWGEQNCWEFDASIMLHWANMLPSVIYEEKIVRDGMGSIKVLVMPHCDVLTEPVYKKIVEFQKKGGIIAADHTHVPGLIPDIDIQEFQRKTEDPKGAKDTLQKQGLELRAKLAPYYTPYASASNPDLVTWVRSSGSADYFFVVNDKRTFGDYWGQYGLVMEKSLPNKGTVSLNRTAGAVYDLVAHNEISFRSENGKTVLDLDFAAKDMGKIFLVLPEKLGKPEIASIGNVRKGDTVELKITPRFASGKQVMSVHPLSIEVTDPTGKRFDDSVPGAASVNGVCLHRISVPRDLASGTWTVLVKDLASGLENTVKFTVE